jgi:UDP-3-O-[3-hydroxymyristoyl] N-acetylglucosamine deacetylase
MTHITSKGEGLFQHTLASSARLSGVGLHSGAMISMELRPAAVGAGISFIRTDRRADEAVIDAAWDRVSDTRMCTVVANEAGASVGTIEHLMAALRAMGVDNAEIHLNGAEVAIMDGSAAAFVEAIAAAGLQAQDGLRQAIRVLKMVRVTDGDKEARLDPAETASFGCDIEFSSAVIGRQRRAVRLTADTFRRDIGSARTFGFLHEVEAMQRMGLARGGSLDNAVVVDGDRVVNEGGLRFKDEFVRHKILDAVGDLYLAGCPIIGHYHGGKSGHALNNRLLHALFADRSAWRYEVMGAASPVGARVAAAA